MLRRVVRASLWLSFLFGPLRIGLLLSIPGLLLMALAKPSGETAPVTLPKPTPKPDSSDPGAP